MSWFYTDTRYPEGHERRYKEFVTSEGADAWLAANDPEGIAWEYPDLAMYLAIENAQVRANK